MEGFFNLVCITFFELPFDWPVCQSETACFKRCNWAIIYQKMLLNEKSHKLKTVCFKVIAKKVYTITKM